MPAETPAPHSRRRWRPEESDEVHQRITATRPLERRGESLELVEHVLQADDRRHGDVRRCRQPTGDQPEHHPVLLLCHRGQRQPAVVGRCVEPSPPFLVGRKRKQRQLALRIVERVDQPLRLLAHRGRDTGACGRWLLVHRHSPGPYRPNMSSGSPARHVLSNCDRRPIARVRSSKLRPSASCRGSHSASAASTSSGWAASASRNVHASAAALAVPAAACGRTVKAASPIRQLWPKTISGTSRSTTTCTKRSSTAVTTSAIAAGRRAAATARASSMWCCCRAPGGTETSRTTPFTSTNRSWRSEPAT